MLRIQLGIITSFVVVKFLLRPFVLEHRFPGALQVFVLSYPNFCEAIVGSIAVHFVLLLAKRSFLPKQSISSNWINALSITLTAAYVISQELKIHNLGGENVYDPYDVLFSVFGLIVASIILFKIRAETSPPHSE